MLTARLPEYDFHPCPLHKCTALVPQTKLLRHLLSEHAAESAQSRLPGLRLRVVWNKQRTLLMLPHQHMPPGKDHCMAVLSYGGNANDQPDSLPGVCGLSKPQVDLPPCQQALSHHLPVLVMVCKTTWHALLYRGQMERSKGNDDPVEYIYLFWLDAPSTSRPVRATINVLKASLAGGIKVKRLLRDFGKRMHINDFWLVPDKYFYVLTQRQLDSLAGDAAKNQATFVEVIIEGAQR